MIEPGLEGVEVAETRLSDVDGAAGRLIVAGHDVEALVETARFEDVAALLWSGGLPDGRRREEIRSAVAAGRRLGWARRDAVPALPDAMEALRAAVALLPAADVGEDAARLTGAVGTFLAAWIRTRRGEAPIEPDPALGHAADVLRMAGDARPAEAAVAALDRYWVTVADHGMNASTFAARVVASTGSDLVSAIVAAIGALKGPLHGGAPGPVLDMLDAVGTPARARSWLEQELARGRRIMGMGHRIYRVRDPRAAVLEGAVVGLERAGIARGRLELARTVEREAEGLLRERHPGRALRANVEFYTALLLEAIGLPREAFAAAFAAGRVVGWCAHVAEQRSVGRLIRPQARYVGPRPGARESAA